MGKVQSDDIKLTFGDIFFNNLEIILNMFIFGVLCCISSVILAFNGFFVGYYVATAHNQLNTVLLIMSHGIFEFSSCILVCVAGFVLFNFLYGFISVLIKQKNSVLNSLSMLFSIIPQN